MIVVCTADDYNVSYIVYDSGVILVCTVDHHNVNYLYVANVYSTVIANCMP